MVRLQEEYAQEFTKFKPDKKLQWLNHLGTVQLDIELEDRNVSVEVPPLEAAVIELFSEKCRSKVASNELPSESYLSHLDI